MGFMRIDCIDVRYLIRPRNELLASLRQDTHKLLKWSEGFSELEFELETIDISKI
jgi:hypothetical protein